MTTKERIENFKSLCQKMNFNLSEEFEDWLVENGFFTAPASTKYHGCYEGGLYDHSFNVTKRLIELTMNNKLEWKRKESPFIIGMFHDLCKCDQYIPEYEIEYISTGNGVLEAHNKIDKYTYNTNTMLKGHGTKSVMLLSQFITLTEEEMLCIRYHMGAYGNEQEQKDEWAGFDKTCRKTNGLCLYSHLADQLASKVDEA